MMWDLNKIIEKSGIYKIINTINSKVYVGSSTHLKSRISSHYNFLKNNKHPNRHLQSAWNKYGEEYFDYEILEYVDKINLIEREQYWIDILKVCDRDTGYNIAPIAGNNVGIKRSEEFKQNLREQNKGWRFYHILTEHDVIQIKMLLKENKTCTSIAEFFNTSESNISQIKNNLSWSAIKLEDYLDENGKLFEAYRIDFVLNNDGNVRQKSKHKICDLETVLKIKYMYSIGISKSDISKQLNTYYNKIRRICEGISFQNIDLNDYIDKFGNLKIINKEIKVWLKEKLNKRARLRQRVNY